MEPEKWDTFLEAYQDLKDKLENYEKALDYAADKLADLDAHGYADQMYALAGIEGEEV